MDEIGQEHFQILALDGGGIKGLYSAALLARLEDDLGIDKITDCFDMVVGTSTGGIIALGLGFGLRPREIVQFYSQHGPSIFPDSWFARKRHYFSRKYSQDPLRDALKKCFHDRRLADSQKRLVIPSYNLDKGEVYLFKTPHHERLRRDWKEPMWKVALATSAAPTYFPSCQEVDHIRLIDGGLWANNPTMVGVVEAMAVLNKPLSAISVLSLGTTDPIEEKPSGLTNGGMLAWRSAAVDACFRGQSLTTLAARAYSDEDNLFDALLAIVRKMPEYIEYRNGRWWVQNPVNKFENFADKWNQYPERREAFTQWLAQVQADFDLVAQERGTAVYESLRPMFGDWVVVNAARKIGTTMAAHASVGSLSMVTGTGNLLTPTMAVAAPTVASPRHTFYGRVSQTKTR